MQVLRMSDFLHLKKKKKVIYTTFKYRMLCLGLHDYIANECSERNLDS